MFMQEATLKYNSAINPGGGFDTGMYYRTMAWRALTCIDAG